jgi:GAF domain-containing protein
MLRASDERALLSELCRVIVEDGGYLGAWVSDIRPTADPERPTLVCAGITPQMATSVVRQPRQDIVPTPSGGTDGSPDNGVLFFSAGEVSTPSQAHGLENSAQRSFALRSRDGELLGHLNIVLKQSDVFDDGEAQAFNELASDLAWVIETLRARESQSYAEQLLLRADRALRTLSAGNRTLLRAADEKQLLHEMSRVVVEQGGYAAAGVAYVEHNEQKSLRPMAWVGFPTEFVEKYDYTWADTEPGHLALGIAIRTGQPAVAKDILTDPAYAYIRDDSVKIGLASNSAFPLRVDGEIIGCLSIAAAEPDAFAEDELRLLGELADDLSFGISMLRLRVKHRAAEQALERMAYFDALTGLPNRASLHQQFAVAVSESRQRRRPLALLLVKVGQFQEISDTLGYQKADALLRDVSLRLRELLNNNEPLARTGEDEFAVLLPSTTSPK